MSFYSELKKRNVFRVAAAYVFASWLVIQVIETILPAFGFGAAVVRITVIALAIGFVPVLVFSWLFEITPDGVKQEAEVDHSGAGVLRSTRLFDRFIMVVLALAVGFFAFDKFVLDPARDSQIEKTTAERVRTEALVEAYGESSIAVLPFVNMSGDASNEYFSDGMAEELLNLLARIPRLRVVSQSSSFSFKGKSLPIAAIAEQLNVAFVLEGSVRKSGDRVRIKAQLVDARSDTQLWSQSYDRTMEDVFTIQDEISGAIVGELRDKLKLDIGPAPAVGGTEFVEAHDAYMRGRYLAGQRIPGSRTAAAVEFRKALSIDPGFAPAHAELAIVLLLGGCGEITTSECHATTRPHVDAAMEIGPNLAESHVAKAWFAFQSESDPDSARAHFRRALEINPNYAAVYFWMANMGLVSGAEEVALARETAVRLDPLSPLANHGWIGYLQASGRLQEARQAIERYAATDPRSAMVLRGSLAALGGNWSAFVLAWLEAEASSTEPLTFGWAPAEDSAWLLAAMGLEQEARQMEVWPPSQMEVLLGEPERALELAREELEADPENIYAQGNLGELLAHTGHYAEARPWLEKLWALMNELVPEWGFAPGVTLDGLALAATLQNEGDTAAAQEVLQRLADYLQQARASGLSQTSWDSSIDYLQGRVMYEAGQETEGISLMKRGAEAGYWIRPAAIYEQDLYFDPRFKPLLEQQAERAARERAKLLEVVCSNNPYAQVWEPEPESCAEFNQSAGE